MLVNIKYLSLFYVPTVYFLPVYTLLEFGTEVLATCYVFFVLSLHDQRDPRHRRQGEAQNAGTVYGSTVGGSGGVGG